MPTHSVVIWFAGTDEEVLRGVSRRITEVVNPFTRKRSQGEIVEIDPQAFAALPRAEGAVLAPLGDPSTCSLILFDYGCDLSAPIAEDHNSQTFLYRLPDASVAKLAGRQAGADALAAEWTARLAEKVVGVDVAARLTALAAEALGRNAAVWATLERTNERYLEVRRKRLAKGARVREMRALHAVEIEHRA